MTRPTPPSDSKPLDLNTLPLPDLYRRLVETGLVARLLELARDEDRLGILGVSRHGDVTSTAAPLAGRSTTARIVARQPANVAGLAVIPDLIRTFDAERTVSLTTHFADGQPVAAGDALATLSGELQTILQIERPLLNLLARLTGVATLTARFLHAMNQPPTAAPDHAAASSHTAGLYDTRKTTPGLRALEKYAVRCGGGRSHRFNLADAILLKDNHLAGLADHELAAFVQNAADRARADRSLRFVQVEADRLEQLDAVLTLPAGLVDIVLLDNMKSDRLREACRRRDRHNPTLELEASGGVNLRNIAEIARTGVDRISVGALTHQATSVDLGLDIHTP